MVTGCKHIALSAPHAGSHRNTTGNGLGKCYNFRFNTVDVRAQKASASSHSSLNFITDNNGTSITGSLGTCLCPFLIKRKNSTFALNRFKHYGCNSIVECCLESLKIIWFKIFESFNIRSKAFRVEFVLTCSSKSCKRSSVEGLLQCNDSPSPFAAVEPSILSCKLDGTFIGFCTGISKEDSFKSSSLQKFCGVFISDVACEVIADVDLLFCLRCNSLYKRLVVMSKTVDCNTGKKVDILFAIYICQYGSFSFYKGNIKGSVIIQYLFVSHNI